MASTSYTRTPKARIINTTTTLSLDTLKLDGLDAESVAALIAFAAAASAGSFASVTITAEADNRGGYGEDGQTSIVKMVFST